MDGHRIYEKQADINGKNTQEFYNMRARQADKMECPYTAVLLGDQNPEHAALWNVFEQENILPKLHITKESNVLDIGCGMGRWAEQVIPLCNYYCGVDFSDEMIKIAKERVNGKEGIEHFEFLNYSFQELVEQKKEEFKRKFDRLIIAGVCMYINDAELPGCLENLLTFFKEDSVFYMTETVGIEKRLTLREFYSDTLKCDYDAIYRTPEEYKEYFKVIEDAGYRALRQGFLPKLNNEEAFSETDRWYSIYKRQ